MQDELLIAKTEKKIYEFLPHEPEAMATTLFVIGMAAYYMWRLFVVTPQHEELVTFYSFISNGPLYSAMNWPSPNNHIGYSVLASFFNFFGNNYVGLRGVSYVFAVSNIILVNNICKKYFSHWLPFAAMVLYSSMQVVNEYSIQGRGYTLATFCFLLATYSATEICKSGETKRYLLVTYVICVVYGVYTTQSSVYWAIPVTLSALTFLFINGFRSRNVYASDSENIYLKKLNSYIAATGISIFATLVLYTLIWITVGAGQLARNSASQFYGMSNDEVFLRNPVRALGTGLEFMMVQRSVDVGDIDLFKERFLSWIVDLLNYMIPGLWLVLLAFIISGMAIMIAECFRHFEYSRTFINLMVVVNISYVVLILLSTHKLPALRGFGYGSFLMTLCVISTFEKIINTGIRLFNSYRSGEKASGSSREFEYIRSNGKWYDGIGVYVPAFIILVLFVARLFDGKFNAQVGLRENDILNSMYIANLSNRKAPCVLDEDQDYLMRFCFDTECTKRDVTGADVVILDKKMLDPNYRGAEASRFYQTYDSMDWDYLDTMHIQYENDSIILYTK